MAHTCTNLVIWLKNKLSNNYVASNVAFGFILMGLEKAAEVEFVCPCNPTQNRAFLSAYFIIPAVMAFTLMLIIQGCRCRCAKCEVPCRKPTLPAELKLCLSSFVSIIVWLMLVFLDGHYFACAMTDWNGRFVLVDRAAPRKWCEPATDEGDVTELMLRWQHFFVQSQGIGIIFMIVICGGLIVYVIIESCQQQHEQQHDVGETDDAETTVPLQSEAQSSTAV